MLNIAELRVQARELAAERKKLETKLEAIIFQEEQCQINAGKLALTGPGRPPKPRANGSSKPRSHHSSKPAAASSGKATKPGGQSVGPRLVTYMKEHPGASYNDLAKAAYGDPTQTTKLGNVLNGLRHAGLVERVGPALWEAVKAPKTSAKKSTKPAKKAAKASGKSR